MDRQQHAAYREVTDYLNPTISWKELVAAQPHGVVTNRGAFQRTAEISVTRARSTREVRTNLPTQARKVRNDLARDLVKRGF